MKRIIQSAFYLILVLAVFSACKKGKADFTLKGTVTDTTFATGLDGATVSLYENEAGSTGTSLIGTSTLGSDGAYSFTFPRNQAESYRIEITKANYFAIEDLIPFSALSVENDNIYDYGTTAKAWVALRFTNQNGQATDVLQYLRQSGKTGCDECCVGGDQFIYGDVDTTIYCINDGNETYSYHYWIQNTSLNGNRSVVTTSFDTTEIHLTY